MEANLRNRLTFGPILLAGLLGILLLDHYIEEVGGPKGVGVLALLIILLPLGTFELARLFAAENVRPFRIIAGVAGGLLIVHAFSMQFDAFRDIAASAMALIIVGVPLAAALAKVAAKQTDQAIVRMAGTLLSVMYLGGLAWFLVALRVKVGDRTPPFVGTTMHLVMILLCVKFTDIGAYFTGKNLGRTKLIFWLSPGKTWEGLAGGLVAAGLVGAACAPFIDGSVDSAGLVWWKGAIFGVVIGFVGQCGDLLESLMKRDAQVKDSGQLIPGFGGVLDVIDSPLVAAPVAYLLFGLL